MLMLRIFLQSIKNEYRNVEESESIKNSGANSNIQINNEQNDKPEKHSSSRAEVCCKYFLKYGKEI